MSDYKVERLRGVISIYKDNEFYAAIESTSAADKLMRDMIGEIQKLKQQLADAEKVIDFYADLSNFGELHQGSPNPNANGFYIYDEEGCAAREYKSKYKVGDK